MNHKPYDTCDSQEHAEIAALLEQLPPAHPTREAYRCGVGTLELTHLVPDRAVLVDGLKTTFLAGWWRVHMRSRDFKPEH